MVKKWRLSPLLLTAALLAGCAAPTGENSTPIPASATSTAPAETVPAIPTPTLPSTPEPVPTPGRGDLTEEQVEQVNRVFSWRENPEHGADFMAVSGFFTSYYEDVRELDFAEFLCYYPSEYGVGEEEFAALVELPGFYWGKEYFTKNDLPLIPQSLPVPTSRIPRSSVDETLKKYAGITTADLKNTDNTLYLPEYDAYYVFTSDFGPGSFTCEGGRVEEDTALLWSEERQGLRKELTLQKEGEDWYIHSFLSVPAPERRELTKEEIASVNALFSYGGERYDIAAAQLFANHYADVTEMDLDDALYYYPDDGCVEFTDTDELDAIRGHVENLDTIMYIVPCHRILRSSVDETLQKFAGVTTAELKTMADALYVPEYDAFYNFSSDYGPGYFTCKGGRMEGDTATLWGKSGSSISFQASGEGTWDVVKLKREGDVWHIKSHMKQTFDPNASLEAFLLSLTGGDVAQISGGDIPEKNALAELIRAGCQNMRWNIYYSDWDPPEVLGTLKLTLADGTRVSLEALDDAGVVRASGPELPDAPAYLCHSGLYELVKKDR